MHEVRLAGQLVCENAGQAEVVARHLPAHTALTREEPGCVSFDVHPTTDPLVWQVDELFESEAAFRAHQARVAASEWGRATAGIRRQYSVEGLPASVGADWRDDRVQSAIEGRNPTVMAELTAAYAVIGDVQFLPGYSLALTKVPGVDRLSDLPRAERVRYLSDVDLLATAVENVCRRLDPAYRRLNVEILGNTDAFLHCHIWPRYEWEPKDIVGKPVWLYPPERWRDPAYALGAAHTDLRAALEAEIDRLRRSEWS